MSAIAAEPAIMNDRRAPLALPSITIRLSVEEKRWFATLARSRGVSEAALALSAIRSIPDSGSLDPYATGPRTLATDRITIRLRPGDGQAIAQRAASRGMRPSAYLAAMVRAHLAMNPPLAQNELAALKQSVAELAGLGTVLAQLSRAGSSAGPRPDDLRLALSRLQSAVATLEDRTHEIVRSALVSWESRRA